MIGVARQEMRTNKNKNKNRLTRYYEPIKDKEVLMDELLACKRKRDQSVRHFASDIKAEVRKAYPASDGNTIQTLEAHNLQHFCVDFYRR